MREESGGMMNDLISRQAAIDALIRKMRPQDNGDGTMVVYIMSGRLVEETLNDLPSAQPEIIHCRDCRYCDRGIDEDGNPFLKCLGWVYGGTQEEDFCSHAERRIDDGD
jgi:hypothetical protein